MNSWNIDAWNKQGRLNLASQEKLGRHRYLLGFVSAIAMSAFASGTAHAQSRSIENPSFEENNPGGAATERFQIYPNANVPGWNSTSSQIELWDTGHSGVNSLDGVVHAEMNAYTSGDFYQEMCFQNGETIDYSFGHRARNIGPSPQTVDFEIADLSSNSIQVLDTSTRVVADGWVTTTGSKVYSGPSGIQRIQFSTDDPGALGNFLDNIFITLTPYVEFALPTYSDAEMSGGNIPDLLVTGTVTAPFDVTVNITGGTATAGSDYTLNTTSVTIPAGVYDGGATSLFPIDLTIIDDSEIEADETIAFSFTLPVSASVGNGVCGTPNATSVYTLTDDDVLPVPDPESGTGVSGTASTPVSNVTDGDTVNGAAAVLGSGGNATISEVGTWPPGFSLDPATGAVNMGPAIAPGTYTMDYQLCDTNSPANCETATITVTVSAPILACGAPENTGVGGSIIPFDMVGMGVSAGNPTQSRNITFPDGRSHTITTEYVSGGSWNNFTMSNARPVGKYLPQLNGVRGIRTTDRNGPSSMRMSINPPANVIWGDAETMSAAERLTVTTNGGVWEQVDGTTPDDDLLVGGLETSTMFIQGLDTRTDNDFVVAVSRNASQLDVDALNITNGGLSGLFLAFVGTDNGDAEASYGPAPHQINQFTSCTAYTAASPYLGSARPDAEDPATTYSTDAQGDDGKNSGSADDEGGVTVPTNILAGQTSDVTIASGDITGVGAGTLHGWIDFNDDGEFDSTEYASVPFNNGASSDLTFSGYGTTAIDGDTFARFRVTTDGAIVDATPKGIAVDGEAEDYVIKINPAADLSITKTNTPGVNGEVDQTDDTVTSGSNTTYTLVVTNNGPSTVTGAVVTDNPASGLTCTGTDAVTITGDGVPTGSFTIADLIGSGIALDTMTDGQSTTLTYSCEVN